MQQQTGINQSALACFWNFMLCCVYIFLHQRPTAGAVKFVITRFIPDKGLLNTQGYSIEMLDRATRASMLQGLTIHLPWDPPQGHFCVQRMTEGVKSELLRWTNSISEAMAARSAAKFHAPNPKQCSSADGHHYKDWVWANGAPEPQPGHGSKPRTSQNSSLVRLPGEPQQTTGNVFIIQLRNQR